MGWGGVGWGGVVALGRAPAWRHRRRQVGAGCMHACVGWWRWRVGPPCSPRTPIPTNPHPPTPTPTVSRPLQFPTSCSQAGETWGSMPCLQRPPAPHPTQRCGTAAHLRQLAGWPAAAGAARGRTCGAGGVPLWEGGVCRAGAALVSARPCGEAPPLAPSPRGGQLMLPALHADSWQQQRRQQRRPGSGGCGRPAHPSHHARPSADQPVSQLPDATPVLLPLVHSDGCATTAATRPLHSQPHTVCSTPLLNPVKAHGFVAWLHHDSSVLALPLPPAPSCACRVAPPTLLLRFPPPPPVLCLLSSLPAQICVAAAPSEPPQAGGQARRVGLTEPVGWA